MPVKQQIIPLLLCFMCVVSSCISFDFGLLKDQKASAVSFQPPPAPYEKHSTKGLDAVWKNPHNGDTLSFFSNCSASNLFTSLEEFQKSLLEGLKGFDMLKKKESRLLRGVSQKGYDLRLKNVKKLKNRHKEPITIRLFLFKKDKCFYALSFLKYRPPVLSAEQGQQEQVFENFIKGFHAP